MLEGILIVLILALDQGVKALSEHYLTPLGTSHPLIPGVFQFTSVHNTGAAWGMFSGFRWVFLALTLVITAAILYALIRYRGKFSVLSRITLSMLLAGALGNAIDRAVLGYVRDMFDFCLIHFPVFNVADSFLTIGCVLLCIDALLVKKNSLFDVLSAKPDKKAEPEPESGESEDA